MCVPCFIKRELKQTLQIPIAQTEQAGNAYKTSFCHQNVRETELASTSFTQIKEVVKEQKKHLDVLVSPSSNYITKKEGIGLNVPIYILHEQYRI